MRARMIKYLDSITHEESVKFFAQCKDKEEFMQEAEEFFNALWDKMFEKLKEE